MDTTKQIIRQEEAGFTLVELAVVLVIIGLLLGGILKGQELIATAQVNATIAQMKGIDAAMSTFKDKYGQLPGDLSNFARLANCANLCAVNGDADGRIESGDNTGMPQPSIAPAVNEEGAVAFAHMAAAGLLQSIRYDAGSGLLFGELLPEAKAGGGMWLGFTVDGNPATTTALRPGHVLVYTGQVANLAVNSNGALAGSQAAQIDRKLDDGVAATGSVSSNGTACRDAGNNIDYDETDAGLCHMYIQVQG